VLEIRENNFKKLDSNHSYKLNEIPMSTIKEQYKKKVIPAMKDKFSYKNIMAIPKIEKVVLNVGIGKIVKEEKMVEKIRNDIAKITGQIPAFRKAKKSIAGFKLREGTNVGLIATLRGKRMYDFIERLIFVALPRSRDFRGISAESLDNSGNLNIGIKEQNIFPEVSYESSRDIFGFQITVTTTAKTKEEGLELLKQIGFPIKT